MLLPIEHSIRPGFKKTELSEELRYNDQNIHWVVIHETANTNPGGGAFSHAKYLWDSSFTGSSGDPSWHYTMDDKTVYQHIPDDEVAFHAGDGGSTPGKNGIYLGGGNRNGIGIETSVAQDGDNYRVWQRTAKFAAEKLVSYGLPLAHMRYHQDFSGKVCPQSLIRGGLIPLFEELAYYEYLIEKNFSDYSISFESHDTDYVDHSGRVINMPDRGLSVSYTVTVSNGSTNQSRTFYTYLPGTVH
jgi:N-acetylmuramoyl-L-alanine amidase